MIVLPPERVKVDEPDMAIPSLIVELATSTVAEDDEISIPAVELPDEVMLLMFTFAEEVISIPLVPDEYDPPDTVTVMPELTRRPVVLPEAVTLLSVALDAPDRFTPVVFELRVVLERVSEPEVIWIPVPELEMDEFERS